ncbi:protein obstructor-E-like [Uloborus diversus]|uniref:protein obstructor-E-like n=1 Tax=Uloborus diversus TaxID=327109 RepID=UPI00240A62AA|nr:protein obstructor-E-like [Uloborus diversus]
MIVLFILPFLVFISAPAALEIEAGNEISRLKSLTGIQNSHHHKDTAHDHFTCPTNQGRFAHPSDCALYYECKNGWPTLKKCRNNQLYDEEKRQCKDKRRVQCYKDNQDQDDKDVSKELDFKCPYIWGSFPHPVDCSKYYLCVYNVPALLSCEKSELYHEKARKCLDKRKVNCGSRLDRDGKYIIKLIFNESA